MRAAIFDLDGTLADTGADLIAAANAALRPFGAAARLDPGADRAVAFRGGRAMIRLGLLRAGAEGGEAEVDRLYPVLLDAYAEGIARETRLYPGVEAALDALAARGWRLGICTNKPAALAERLLSELGIRRRFAGFVGAGTLAERKPHPAPLTEAVRRSGGAPGRAVLVGDTVTDRDAARAAGLPVVLVAFGPEGAGVAALEPDALLPGYADLPDMLERLVPAGRETA